MENAVLTPHASVLSRSALHAYITGPSSPTPPPKSAFNPYRKRSALLNIVSLEAAEVLLQQSLAQEQGTQEVLSLADTPRPLSGVTAAT